MNRYFKVIPLTIAAVFTALAGQAQEQANVASSTGAVRPINVSDQMFRKTIWRQIDLREKQNQPLFSDGKEISRVIIEAVKRGELQAYRNDSLTSTFSSKEAMDNMSYGIDAPPPVDDALGGFGPVAAPTRRRVPVMDANGRQRRDRNNRLMWKYVTSTARATPPPPPPPTTAPYRYKDLYQMELTEEMIFDKKRSRMYHQIKTMSLKVPATLESNLGGLEKNIATFKYSDLVKVFRNNPQTAIWFNAQNDAQHKNLADAFELWLFSSYIVRVSNSKNERLSDVYGGDRQGMLAAQQTASELVELEYNLWSY